MPRTWVIATTMALALAGCDGARRTSTNASAGASASAGDDVAVAVGSSTGNIAVNVPGFQGALQVPPRMISSANFDIDGVKLYPGSKIGNMDVRTTNGTATVHVAFTSPAGIAAVTDYFRSKFLDKGKPLAGSANGIEGMTAKGDRFTIALTPEGTGQTRGVATIIDTKD